MENKKLGFIIIGISVIASVLTYGFMKGLNSQTTALNCYPSSECQRIESLFNLSHAAVGLISFIAALGFYLLFFSTSEEAILKRLEEEKNAKIKEDKFGIVLKALDENEKKVIMAVKEQEGITQTTLRYRTDLSKAKISQILTDFEKKNIVRRVEKGKTYEVHLTQDF